MAIPVARILVVDDRPVGREFLVTVLTHGGYETVEAENGALAYEQIRNGRIDAVIVDEQMPGQSGSALIGSMRGDRATRDIPVVVYSAAFTQSEVSAWKEQLGVSEVIAKPADPQTILRAVDRMLHRPPRDFEYDLECALGSKLAAVVELGLSVASAGVVRDMIAAFVTRAHRIVNAEDACVAIPVAGGARRCLTNATGTSLWEPEEIASRAFGLLQSGTVRRAVRIDPGMADDPLFASSLPSGFLAAAPIEQNGLHYGVAWFGRTSTEFTANDLRLIDTMVGQIALVFEQLRAQESLSAELLVSNDLVTAIVAASPVAIAVVDSRRLVALWNPAAESLFGWTAAELIGKPIPIPPVNAGHDFIDRERTVVEPTGVHRNGTPIDLRISAASINNAEGQVILMMEDVTERNAARKELERRARSLELLSGKLLRVQELERTRIAREIHDELGQLLTAAKLEITSTREGQKIQRATELIDRAIQSVRDIATQLRPAALDQLGLLAAVESEVNAFSERTGIECDLSIRPAELDLDAERSTALFRILQEGLTNIARHAEANRVEIRMRQTVEDTLLEIRDDGRGIAQEEAAASSSIGLLGVRERVRALHGSVLLEGISGRGTIFSVRLPREAV